MAVVDRDEQKQDVVLGSGDDDVGLGTALTGVGPGRGGGQPHLGHVVGEACPARAGSHRIPGDLQGGSVIPSAVEPGAFLVRFFRDQQDCVLWYFYLRPGSSAFVVHSHLEYEYEAHSSGGEFNGNSDIDDLDEQMEALQYCALTLLVVLGQVRAGVGMPRWQVGQTPVHVARRICSSRTMR
ncbi:hypothetical protein ABZ934_32235 [Streptomyces sp. NPDC046557]|uniref:hypothetical protein n=1 Tax=Streptomyces sp. NPDC046557 TaxID=3155372 RepID=UPI0033F6EA9D